MKLSYRVLIFTALIFSFLLSILSVRYSDMGGILTGFTATAYLLVINLYWQTSKLSLNESFLSYSSFAGKKTLYLPEVLDAGYFKSRLRYLVFISTEGSFILFSSSVENFNVILPDILKLLPEPVSVNLSSLTTDMVCSANRIIIILLAFLNIFLFLIFVYKLFL